MLKSSFCLALLIIYLCVNYSLNASNFSESDQCNLQRFEIRIITVLKNFLLFLKVLIRLTECSLKYNIDRMVTCVPSINHFMKITDELIKKKSKALSSKENEIVSRAHCSSDLTSLFKELNDIIDICLNKNLQNGMVKSLHDQFFKLQTKLYFQITFFNIEDVLPNYNERDILSLFQRVSSAAAYSITRLMVAAPIQNLDEDNNMPREETSRSKKTDGKFETKKQYSQLELEEASRAADLNAHLMLGCCTDGTCGSLEQKSKIKVKNKKSGGKKLKNTVLDEEENLQGKPGQENNTNSEPLIFQCIELLTQIIHKLSQIAELEEKLIVAVNIYETAMQGLMANAEILVDKGLKERLSKLRPDMKFQSSSEKAISALKSQYGANIKKISESLFNKYKEQADKKPCFKKPNGQCHHCKHCNSRIECCKDGETYSID
ncbi:signal peptide protein [Cryptosporidium sp. chipmunk genotype I]|uniref:signal peptide protein n=1 Tax=Cryptosporidium sp. chipmunk genotype I TaxID=1280935 RepID=UPI00351A72F2|nr:signal peptide protein [Cryptosporidium sp. chipmunk genotype I]